MIGVRFLTISLLMACGPAAAQDAVAGAAAFQTYCSVCHSVDKPARNKLGPSLIGVVGRQAGATPDYSYSQAMKAYGQAWTPANLDRFLAAPVQVVPNTKMGFAGVKDAAKRANLIAYLKTQK
jgi:cytochrome c